MDRLYTSKDDKVFAGVCGGIGEYFNIDPVIIRLLWIVSVIFGGTGVLAYLVAMLIIPKAPLDKDPALKVVEPVPNKFWGVLLIIAGFLLLIGMIGPLAGLFASVAILMSSVMWPILVILLGLYLYFNSSNKKDIKSSMEEVFPPGKKLYRSISDRRISGVCGGIGAYFSIDANIIRILWVMATLGSFGFGVLAYFVMVLYLNETD